MESISYALPLDTWYNKGVNIYLTDLSPYAPIRYCPIIKSNMRLSLECEAKLEYNE